MFFVRYRKRAGPDEAWVLHPSHPRIKQASLLVLYCLYLELCKKSFAALHCVPLGGEWRLSIEPSRECFVGVHAFVAFVATGILLLEIALPVWLFCVIRKVT